MRVENYQAPGLVSFKSAYTHVAGSFAGEKPAHATTLATTTIEGFNLLDFVTADRITARLTSEHKLGDEEGHIIAIGSAFENLRIGGYPVKVKLRHDLLLKCKTHKEFAKEVASDTKHGRIASTKGGQVLCSLVEEIETDFPGLTPHAYHLHIPHFGTISLAEIHSEQGKKTLTMLGFELGCPVAGSGTAGQARTNGQTGPPVPNGG